MSEETADTREAKQVEELTAQKAITREKPLPPDWIGSMKDAMEIVADIITPASDEIDWEVLRN